MTMQLPIIGFSTVERVRQRSSSAKQADLAVIREAKAQAQTIWQNGMDLLKSIWNEEKVTLAALWAAPDADEFAAKIQQVTPKADSKLVEETIAAFIPDSKLAEKVSETVAANRKAKAELKELAKKK